MHICFVSLDYPTETGGGGVGTYVQTLGRELVRLGHRVSVVTLRRRGDAPRGSDGAIRIRRIAPGNLHWYLSRIPLLRRVAALPLRELEYGWAVLRAVREIDRQDPIDLVEATETGAGELRHLRPGLTTVIRLHGEVYTFALHIPPRRVPVDVRLSRLLQRRALRAAHALTAPSRSHAEAIRAELGEAAPPIEVIPNPVPESPVAGRDAADAAGPVFLFVGRLQAVKGVETLIEAVPPVLAEAPGSRFLLAGSEHPSLPRHALEAMTGRLGIAHAVEFLGHVPAERLRRLYGQASAAVLPSHYESFGYVCLEALRQGVPVVTTATGIAPEVVEEGVNGLLVPAGNARALAEACLKALNMPKGEVYGEVHARFSAGRVAAQMAALYQGLAAGRPVGTTVFLSPHFDDAVFSCGGLIDRCVQEGERPLVVTVFGGTPDYAQIGSFVRQIHAKWRHDDPVRRRQDEDRAAVAVLQAQALHLDFLDCIYRRATDGRPLYDNYESLKGALHAQDAELPGRIRTRLEELLGRHERERVRLFAPLGVGNHVDHRIVREVGLRLAAEGYRVFFYEELPYSFWEAADVAAQAAALGGRWCGSVVPVDLKAKLRAVRCYRSQLAGIGGSFRRARRQFAEYAIRVGGGTCAERFWTRES